MELDTDRKAANLLQSPQYAQKSTEKKRHNTVKERFQNDSLHGDSLTEIGWDQNTCITHDKIAKEDHDERGTMPELVETRIKRRGCKWTTGSES